MAYNQVKVEEMTLALMFLTSFGNQGVTRSWKGYDWDVLSRLHEAGHISDPVGKTKSVMLTDKGKQLSEELFQKHFFVRFFTKTRDQKLRCFKKVKVPVRRLCVQASAA